MGRSAASVWGDGARSSEAARPRAYVAGKLNAYTPNSLTWSFDVFFFQAEDGIRDIGVTGVQTCALPIYRHGQVMARAGVPKAGHHLAMAITPYFFNLIDVNDPNCPIRAQVIPRAEEMVTAPWEMADPCGEDEHMPVPGLVHRYPDRVLFLVTDRCAAYCRYCTRSRVVSGAGEQHLHTEFTEAINYI